jgi:transcriptional regulator with XRE-family HTH domain
MNKIGGTEMGTLYENIISLCNERGIKGGKLCTDIGMSKGILTDLKMGRQTGISAANAQKIAAYFNVSVGYLLGEETKKEQPTEIDGLSEKQRVFIDKVMQMSDEELDRLDKILSLVENTK